MPAVRFSNAARAAVLPRRLHGVVAAQAIADLNFTGHVGHEYSPAARHDALASLAQAMKIMQV